MEALDQLGDKQRTDVEAEFAQVYEMACSLGVHVLIEEAGSVYHKLDWAETFEQMENPYEKALFAFMNDRNVFEIASDLAYMDRIGAWKQRYVGEGLTPAVEEKDKKNLADAVCAFYGKQGRGRHCKVDNYRRENPERHCYFAYPEDHATTEMGYDDKGEFHRWPIKPAFEVIFVYQPQNGFLYVRAKGKGEDIEELQEIFCQTILALDRLPDKKAKHFDLEPLKNKEIRFSTDPADGVDAVYVRMLRLDVPGTGNRRITFEANSPGDGKAVYKLIDRALAKQSLSLDDVAVAKAKLQFKFAGKDGKRGKSLTFEISTPDRCTLKDDPMDQIAKSMSNDGGLSVDGFLAQLAKRLRIPDADIVTGDEIQNWPDGKLQELLDEGILEEIEPGTTVVCDQCDERCSIEPQRRTDPHTGRVVGVHVCLREEAGGRMEIDLDRLRRWQVDKKRLWHLVYGLESEWEVPWDDNDGEYIPLQEAVNLANSDSITVKGMSRLLEDREFPVHRMRRGRRCQVHLGEFRAWLKYAQHGKVTDKAIKKYVRGCEERKKEARLKKSHPKSR